MITNRSAPASVEIPSVDWWVTSRCNLACDFCYGPVPGADPVDLRPRIARAISGSPARAVTFCGGEPLLVKELVRYARLQREAGKLAVLNTNGELLRRRFGSTAELPFDVVGISIDGPTEPIHRRMRGAEADFAETVAAARWLADGGGGIRRKIGTVISSVNVGHVAELARLVRGLGPDVWRIYQFSPWGPQNRGVARHRIGAPEFASAVARAAEIAAPVPVESSTVEMTGGCLIVDPSGDVLAPRGTDYVSLGSCLDEGIENIWRRSTRKSIIDANKRWLRRIE
jgi:MoaA/NifB/PqqE/SkfB family radical SAM enzyme